MSSVSLPTVVEKPRAFWRLVRRKLSGMMPKGLYARSILIVILPMILLQCVVTFVFMERHTQLVTVQLSRMLTQDIAALIDLADANPKEENRAVIGRVAQDMRLDVQFLAKAPLPPPLPKPLFQIVDSTLSKEIHRQIGRPFWLDTVGHTNFVEIRIELDDSVMRVLALRNAAAASNSYIFLLWMLGTSLVLIVVALAFLRNQIRPIMRLVGAAEAFGKGREVDFRPRGAREIRRAGYAFIEMKRRIERAIEQRTTMLNGVSHDLRTILTRFKLSLALMRNEEAQEVQRDIEEMQRMLEAYLAFARGDTGEASAQVDMQKFLEELRSDAERNGHAVTLSFSGEPHVTVRPDAFRRCVVNLLANACRYAKNVSIEAVRDQRFLTINVDDDGPGIPAERREEAFRPFVRLDEARNQDPDINDGTGLGLAIARDIASSHGGDIMLAESPQGGLRATVRIPV